MMELENRNAQASEGGKESQSPYGGGRKVKPERENEQGWSDETELRSPETRPKRALAASGGKQRSESQPKDERRHPQRTRRRQGLPEKTA